MKYIKQYENHVKLKKAQDAPVKEVKNLQVINESVEIIDDMYEVRTTTSIPQSLINSFIKKSETNLGIKVRDSYSHKEIAEMLVNKILKNNIDIEKLNPSDFFGGGKSSEQGTAQTETTPQESTQTEPAPQEAPAPQEGYESTEENLPQEEPQAQVQNQEQV
jgi:hypothetical protein